MTENCNNRGALAGVKSLLGRHESVPGLVIIEHSDLDDATWWFVNNFQFFMNDFRACTFYTIRIMCR